MLKAAESELLTRVGPGTPMGAYMRAQWIIAVRSEAVEAGGAPVRVRLLGEDYVAFRSPGGALGVMDEACPHRGVSLALGRNEECGLRCIYHGWQFDTDGNCVDIPNEYPHRREAIAKAIKVRHFPSVEKAGLVWVYLGPGEPPPVPNFEWTNQIGPRPPFGAVVKCNWLQTLEGSLDPDHVGQLHSSWFGEVAMKAFSVNPQYEIVDQPYGFTAAATRDLGKTLYVRVKEMALPWYAHIPFNADQWRALIVSIPIDDETTYVWYLTSGPKELSQVMTPTSERLKGQPESVAKWQYMVDTRLQEYPDPDNFRKTLPSDPTKLWDQDRSLMAGGHYTGLPGFVAEDMAVFEAMGTIQDRSKENLVVSDQFITRLRRKLLAAVDQYAKTGSLPAVDYDNIVAIAGFVPPEKTWRDVEKSKLNAPPVAELVD